MPRFTERYLIAGLAGMVILFAAFGAEGRREVIDRIAAVIEDDVITLRELEEKASPFFAQLAEIEDPAVREAKRREILRKVLDIEIGEKIVNEELEKNRERLGVTTKDVDHAIEEVMRINNMTRDRLQAALYSQGMTWSEYRTKLREQIERARLIQFKVQGKVQISPGEVKRRCEERQGVGAGGEQVCAAHILMNIAPGASAEEGEMIHARASKLQAELSAGADFAAYALKYSDDKGAPDGDLGCFGRGEMVEAFENAAFSTKVGEVSPVVKTSFGFHIIKVFERKAPPSPCTDEESLTPFRNEVYQLKLEEQMSIWIDDLRKKAFVEIRLEELAPPAAR